MKKLWIFLLLTTGLVSGLAFANHSTILGIDFAAPVIPSKDNLSNDNPVGTLVYESNTDTFYGLGMNSGAAEWKKMSFSTIVAAEMNNTCDSDPCTVDRQKGGSWIDSTSKISFNSTGDYTVNFTSGFFTTTPICVVTALNAPGGSYCNLNGVPSTSGASVKCYDGDLPSLNNSRFSIVCFAL